MDHYFETTLMAYVPPAQDKWGLLLPLAEVIKQCLPVSNQVYTLLNDFWLPSQERG